MCRHYQKSQHNKKLGNVYKMKDCHNYFVKLYKASSLSQGFPTFETRLPSWELVESISLVGLKPSWACAGPMLPSGLTSGDGILVESPHG